MDLKKELHISLLFISHDIGVVRFISDRVGVMYLGTLVEETDTERLFENPRHPYTQALFAAAPDISVRKREFSALTGEQPVRTEDFTGCAFCSRCPYVTEQCRKEAPKLREIEEGHRAACHRISWLPRLHWFLTYSVWFWLAQGFLCLSSFMTTHTIKILYKFFAKTFVLFCHISYTEKEYILLIIWYYQFCHITKLIQYSGYIIQTVKMTVMLLSRIC